MNDNMMRIMLLLNLIHTENMVILRGLYGKNEKTEKAQASFNDMFARIVRDGKL